MSSLLRSTKLVRYFTGAARTLILNTAKSTETATLINPKTLCSANNVLMRDYATSKKAESLEPLLQRLDSEVRRFGRITKRDIDEVFDELKAKNDITSSQSLLVIRCCGELVPEELPEQRTLLVQKIWNVLTERGIPMDISHYNALLRVYIENEHPFSPAKFLEELESKGLQPNRVTYQRLMWRYCQEGDVEGATKVLEKMRELNFPVSEPVLNALIMGHAFHGDTDGAKAVLETMAGAGLSPSNRTYTLLACGYAKNGDIDGINNVIKSAIDKDIFITDRDILDIIEHLAVGGHSDKVEQMFTHLQKNVGYNQDVCNLVLRLLNKGQIDTAKAVMKTMPKTANIEDTIFKGAFFVKQLLRINLNADRVIQICKELKEEDLVPSAMYIATETALQLGQTELAQKLFKEIEKEGIEIRQHYYWPILAQKGKEGDEEGLVQVLRTMSSQGLVPTGETLRDYVLPYLIGKDTPQNIILKLQIANVPVILSARNVMFELLETGKMKEAADVALQYRIRGQYSLMTRPLLNALTKTKDTDSFVSILHIVSSKPQNQEEDQSNEENQADENISTNEIGRLVKSAVKSLGKIDLTEKLLTGLYQKGLRISTESAEAIQQYHDMNMTTSISELLTKLTASDLEPVTLESPRRTTGRTSKELERLISQVKSKGGNITKLQKQLLSVYMQENNVEKVKSYLEELKGTSFELTSGTLAQLYEFFCQNDEIEKANECKAQLAAQSPEFELNTYKLIQMVHALVRANKYDEAIQFLKDNKPKMEGEHLSFLQNSKCWQLLNMAAEQKDETKVLELTKALIENKFVEPSNVILGPSIKVYLLKGDVDGALKQFEICCNQYRCTPWKGELMKALIMKEDATKLQWLADLSTQIHGEVNILHDLVLAFVECGRLRQARRILETPGMHTRQRRLDDACQRYVEEGKSEYLEGLLEATKELSYIDRANIFYHLLVTYCKADKTDKALGLWTTLQEEDEIPSKQFLLYLGNHLKSKNREVPFVMPEQDVRPKEKKEPKKQKLDTTKLPTKNEISEKIETLVKKGNSVQALNEAVRSIQTGVMPRPSVLKYLLKDLAENGKAEKVKELGNILTDPMKRRLTYDDKLTLATFKQGGGAKHIDELVRAAEAANTVEEFEAVLQKFPRSTALASILNDEEVVAKCRKVADLAASKGIFIPINLLWMEYVLAGNEKEANKIWDQWLSKAPSILFRRLLQESHFRNDTATIEYLIKLLKTNDSLSKGSLGNAYSRLISMHLVNNNVSEAEATLRKAIGDGVGSEHLNASCLNKLKAALVNSGKEYNYFN